MGRARQAERFIAIAAVLGLIGVGAGAFGAHALRKVLDVTMQATYETAVRYQLIHVLALLAVGILARDRLGRSLTVAGWSFIVGIGLFSGSLYALTLSGVRGLGAITPFGGIAFLIGWFSLFLAFARARKD